MIRKEKYPVEQILPQIGSERVVLDGDSIKLNSLRMINFKAHGITCVTCGIKGEYFAKEKHHNSDKSYHLNLYGRDLSGKEILMTRDHIIAEANGGPDTLKNLQTMCTICNKNKGCSTIVEDSKKIRRKKLLHAYLMVSPVILFLIIAALPTKESLHNGCLLIAIVPIIVYITKLFVKGMDLLLENHE